MGQEDKGVGTRFARSRQREHTDGDLIKEKIRELSKANARQRNGHGHGETTRQSSKMDLVAYERTESGLDVVEFSFRKAQGQGECRGEGGG